MIVVVLLVLLVVVAGLVLGRTTHEVESARDTEYVELEGRWIRYSVIGGGPPVLLVHGWLSSSRIWEPLARRLAQRFTVYTLDLAGFGDSDKPTEGYGARYGSRLLYAFCAHFGLIRATVVGHDLSGPMAVKLAADHPDIVGRLVLVSAPADEDQIDLPTLLWLTTLPVVGPVFYSLGRLLKPLRRRWMRHFVFDPENLPDELVEDSGKSTPAAASKTFSVTRHELSGGRIARQARIIKVPMLLVAGEDDQIVDPRAVSDWGQNADQAEIMLLDRCGHLPMVESPAEFNASLLTFLTGDSRYLEYVREVPPAAVEEPYDEVLEEPGEIEEPEERVPAEPAYEAERDRASGQKPDFFGDMSWDFSPKKPTTPRPVPRSTPRPETPAAEAGSPATPPRTSRRSGPAPENEGAEDAARGAPAGASEKPRKPGDDKGFRSGRIPEFSEDLFEWSDAPDEFRPGRRSGGRRNPREDGRERDE